MSTVISNNDLRKITGKKLEVDLKHGATWESFAKKYNCTQEEFLEYIEKNLTSNAVQSIVRKLNQNSKNRNKQIRRCKNSSSKLTREQIAKDINTSPEQLETTTDLKEQLKKNEQSLINKIMNQEKQYEEMITKKSHLFDLLRKSKKEMEQLKKQALEIKNEVERVSEQITAVKEEIAVKKENLLESNQRLEIVRNDIKQLEKISIFAYKDGEIELEKEGEEMELEIPTSWQDVFESLLHNKLLENFSIKQVKQLSKLLVLVEEMEVKEEIFEMTFEDQEMQEIYYQII